MTTPKKTQNELEEAVVAIEEDVVDGEQSTMLTPDADFNLDEAIEAILVAAGHQNRSKLEKFNCIAVVDTVKDVLGLL